MKSQVKITGSAKGGFMIMVDDELTHNHIAVTKKELLEIITLALEKLEVKDHDLILHKGRC